MLLLIPNSELGQFQYMTKNQVRDDWIQEWISPNPIVPNSGASYDRENLLPTRFLDSSDA